MPPSAQGLVQGGYGAVLPNDPNTDVHQQNNENTQAYINNPSPDDLPILEQLMGTRRKMRIAILGAGLSGLNFLKRAEERLKNVELVCYEKNADVGGTWYVESRIEVYPLTLYLLVGMRIGTLVRQPLGEDECLLILT